MATEFVEVIPKIDRQAQIDAADIGDVVSIGRRIDLSFGLPEGLIAKHTDQMRGILDTQALRARRRHPGRKYSVENGYFMTRSGALMVIVTCTRVE